MFYILDTEYFDRCLSSTTSSITIRFNPFNRGNNGRIETTFAIGILDNYGDRTSSILITNETTVTIPNLNEGSSYRFEIREIETGNYVMNIYCYTGTTVSYLLKFCLKKNAIIDNNRGGQ